ncbi:ethanolamine ammonia-lyase reactivating factor EutA [Candidatus Saccharibacteria bacterium]|nr:ethanolamine ammonia-lyase reactivating factor EutA [Candidatus Saccharibacteria bacterium]
MLNKLPGLSGTRIKDLKSKLPKAIELAKKHRRPVESYLVGLDIGTEFIKALIGRVVGNEVEIIGVGRAHQELADMQAGAIADIAAVVANCDQALSAAEQQAGVSARTAIIGIAGELVKGTTSTVRFTRKSPSQELSIEEMQHIIELVQQRAEQKARQQLVWELGGQDVQVRLVNSALVRIDIDGYKVTNPVGFQGRDVVVEIYTAFAPMIHIGALERTATELDLELLAVAAEPFAVARSVVGDDPNAQISAILMDVGGGTTDIAVVNEGGVEGTKMFGIGGRAFTRAIERELDIDFVKAEALKVGLSSEQVAATQKPAIEKALQKTLNVWTKGVELALAEFEKPDHLPNRLLLCGGGSSLQMLMEQLEVGEWYKNLPFSKKPQVQHIQPDEVVGITDATGDVSDHTFITAMGLLRVGMDTVNSGAASTKVTMKNKLNKVLRV